MAAHVASYDIIFNNELSHLPDIPGILQLKHFLCELSGKMHIPSDQARFVLTMIAFIPLGFLFRHIPGKVLKNIYCLFLGFCGTWLIMGVNSLNILVSSLITYILVLVLMPKSPIWLKPGDKDYNEDDIIKKKQELYQKRQRVGNIVMVFAMGYICIAHVYRYVNDYMGYRLDFTAAQMLLTIKLTAYAWNRVDGETLNDGLHLHDIRGDEKYRNDRAIRSTPNLLQYLAWIYHFTSVIAGPSIDYREYEMYIDGSLWRQYGLEHCPSTIKPTLIKLMYTLLSYPGVMMMSKLPILRYVNTPQFELDYPQLWQRMLYVSLVNGFTRYKYYFAWYLAETGCTATGISLSGYNEKTGELTWDRCNGVRAWVVESATSLGDLIGSWNIRCSEWLKHYVYLRAVRPSFLSKTISQNGFANILTKMTSAFWHGCYPGYYLFFLQVYFMGLFETRLQRMLLPYFSRPNPDAPRKPIMIYPRAWIYNVIMNIFTLGSFHWCGAAFVLLELGPTIQLHIDSYFIYYIWWGSILYLLPYIVKKLTGYKMIPSQPSRSSAPGAASAPVASVIAPTLVQGTDTTTSSAAPHVKKD